MKEKLKKPKIREKTEQKRVQPTQWVTCYEEPCDEEYSDEV